METIKFVYYQENDKWVGWLEEYPDYRTQGTTLEELKENLKDIYADLTSGTIPHVRRRGEIVVGLRELSWSERSRTWDVSSSGMVENMIGIKIRKPGFLNLFRDTAK